MEELGTDGRDNGTGGIYPTGIGDIFQGGGTGGTPIRLRDVGDEPLHVQGPGECPAQIRQAYYRETDK